MKHEPVRADELKVGDLFLWSNIKWRILTVPETYSSGGNSIVKFDVEGDNISTDYLNFYADRQMVRLVKIVRSCAPCRDSDCDCIYDEVG